MTEGKRFAVITGASSGIGLALAREFAGNGYDLLLCAEDDGLDDAAATISGSVQVDTVRADLATAEGVQLLVTAVIGGGRDVDALVLNAGVGNNGAFVDIPLADEERLLALNIGSTVRLSKRLLPAMVRRGSGGLLFTASVASTMPGPYYATYAASKAFVLSFAEAIRKELKETGVTVTALMPGPTDTNFFSRAGMQGTTVDQGPKDDPAQVARQGYQAFVAGKDHIVGGSLKNLVQTTLGRLLTDPVKAAVHARMTKPGSGSR
jgi:short-subunit dehydrogenase